MSLWNGYRSALSLTFDDTLPCQLANAVPAMNKAGIQGTFFAIAECEEYPLDVWGWRRGAVPFGHEIGSHSLRHRKAATLTPADARAETELSKKKLENHFDIPVVSYCYPYTDAPALLQSAVRNAGYKQARGGRVARQDKFVLPFDGLNFFDVTCYHVSNTVFENGELVKWLTELVERGAWLTLMFHAVGDNNGWDNVKVENFLWLVDSLRLSQDRGHIWVAPFGTVAENLRSNQ
jgi:peptidoglycan/xylan/chitin deacetylase (PgdA/CDA1 family)